MAKKEKVEAWAKKQRLMALDYGTSQYRLTVWAAEETYAKLFGKGFTLNLGAGDCPIPADLSCDPLIRRDVICVGEHLPFQPVFDTVLIFSVLDHVLDDKVVVQEAARVLRPEGRILVMQSVWGWNEWRAYARRLLHGKLEYDHNHLRHYHFKWSLLKMFRKADCRVLDYRVELVAGSRVSFATVVPTK